MLLVVGVWTFLRALLFGSTAIALENLALRHQLRVLQRSVRRPRLARWDRILWVWLCRVWAGWRSSLVIVQRSRRRCSRGTAEASSSTGGGSPGRTRSAARSSPPSFATSSDAWRAKTPPGAAAASRPNSPRSATRSPSCPWPSTCTGPRLGRRPRGAPSSPRTPESSSLSTSCRVAWFVTSPCPHGSVRADFPHTALQRQVYPVKQVGTPNAAPTPRAADTGAAQPQSAPRTCAHAGSAGSTTSARRA